MKTALSLSALSITALLALPAYGDCGAGTGSCAAKHAGLERHDGGKSPEDVFERARNAAKNNDQHSFFQLVAPDMRALMGFVMVTGARMGIAMKASMEGSDPTGATNELEALLRKHGVKSPPDGSPLVNLEDKAAVIAAARPMFEGVDVGALITDLQGLMTRLGFERGNTSITANEHLEGELTDLQIDGDHATASVGGEPGKFVRVNGRWYLEPDDEH
jgi:hypothetical protein